MFSWHHSRWGCRCRWDRQGHRGPDRPMWNNIAGKDEDIGGFIEVHWNSLRFIEVHWDSLGFIEMFIVVHWDSWTFPTISRIFKLGEIIWWFDPCILWIFWNVSRCVGPGVIYLGHATYGLVENEATLFQTKVWMNHLKLWWLGDLIMIFNYTITYWKRYFL